MLQSRRFNLVLVIHSLTLYPSHLYTAFRALDANRRLMQRDKGSSAACSLGPGWAYFVEPRALNQELCRVESKQGSPSQAEQVRPY
jgi:hypothetical protein